MNEILIYLILFISGILAGFINTLAGGGSLLVLPILILAGVSPIQANATNRVAILFQNITGVHQFHKYGKLKLKPFIHIICAAMIGSVIGTLFVVNISSALFDKILGIVLLIMLFFMFKPHKKNNILTNKLPGIIEFLIFLLVGFYGGFIQIGVGFILLATLSLVEELDLIQANAVKVFLVMSYTFIALIIFAYSGLIIWKYGLVLASGNTIGAFFGVKTAIKKGEKFIRVILLFAVVLACLKLFGVFGLFN